jgi:hypothetical protein
MSDGSPVIVHAVVLLVPVIDGTYKVTSLPRIVYLKVPVGEVVQPVRVPVNVFFNSPARRVSAPLTFGLESV